MSLKRKDLIVPGGLRVAANDPHLVSLGGGRLSTAVTIHNIPIGSMTIGSSPNCSILLKGSGVQSHHCTLHRNENGEVLIVPENEARVLIDGNRITLETSLTQGAMITIGNSNYLRFNNPAEAQMIKSAIGSNERISMAQIDFAQDHRQNDCSFNKGGILNNALKGLTKPYDTHIKQNKPNNETISEKISKVEYININNFHSPKVFTADSITVNTPAKDVLGPKYANFTKNLSTNHKIDKNFCIKNNEINYSTKTSNSSTSFSQSSYNEILTKIKNNNKEICNCTSSSPFRNQNEIISAVYDRYPKIDGNLQLFPLNSVNLEINTIKTDSNKKQQYDQQQQQKITAQEQENLEEILKICTEYDRQQQNHSNISNNNNIQSSSIVQNRIKTNGSLPRDKKSSSFLDLNSQTKALFPAAAAPTMTQAPIKIGNNSNYENVRIIGDRSIEISPSNFHHNFYKSSSGYENVIIGKYTPQSPRTKIRTTCTSPQAKKDISYLSQSFNTTHNILSQSESDKLIPMTADVSSQSPTFNYHHHNQSNNDYCHLIQTFEDKLKKEIHALQECTKNDNPIFVNSTNIGSDSLRKRQNLNINNLTLNLNLVKNNNSNDLNSLNIENSEKLIENEKDGIINKKSIDELKIDRGNVLTKIRKLKTQIADIQRQEDEVLRELDLEKALVNAEMSTVSVSLFEMENTSKSLQLKIHRLEAQRNANRVMQETQQAKLKQSIGMKQEQVTSLQQILKNNESDPSLKEEYEKELESLENDRKIFEDLEFQYLEEETDWMAYRDELHNDLRNLFKEIENRQLQIIHLQTQGLDNQNSACIDTKALENNLLSLLKELEKSREELQVIDKVIFKTSGEQEKVIEQQNYSDSDDEIDFKKNKNGFISQSFFGSTEVLSAKSKESTNLMSRSINENMFFNNNIEMPIKTVQNNKSKEGITIYEITELSEDSMNKVTKSNDKKVEIIPEIVRRIHNNDEKDPILKLKYNVKAQNDETPKVNLNLSLESDDFEVNTLDKRVPSQDDIDRICKVTSAAPISTTKGASSKIIESIKEIERNRQLLLAQQGSYVIEHERQKMIELKKKCHNEARAQYLSSHSIAEQNNSRSESRFEDISSDFEEKQNQTIDDNTILDGKFDNYCSQQELQQHKTGQQHRHSHPELEFQRSRPLSDVNSKMNCENLKQRQFKSNNDLSISSASVATASNRLSENSEDTKRSSFNSNIVLDFEKSIRQNNKRVTPKQQRPLTRYLPIMSSDLDLQQHIESAGHQISLCPHVIIDSYSCRGYLHKLGATFHGWSRRWFVLDRKKNAFIYYSDRLERKPRGGAYFSTIEEVYLDHLNTSKSGRPHCTFIVKTRRRSYHLQAASDATARIWIDAIITGAQGNIGY